jgi:general secretion pathway protein D
MTCDAPSRPSAKALGLTLFVCLVLIGPPAGATRPLAFSFENVDLHTVVKTVAQLTGITFLFDPARVKGNITLIAPGDVSGAQALELLRSALALHGYALVARAEGTWIMPADETDGRLVVRVVPLDYARAREVAFTLAWVAPPGVRIAPYVPTNSVVITGPARVVEQFEELLRRR